jgi:hypothetical protein
LKRGDLNFDINVALTPQALANLKLINQQLRSMPNVVHTRVAMDVNDQVTPKVNNMSSMLKRVLSSIFDVDTSKMDKKLKGLRNTITGMFRSDEGKKWYEKIFGFLSGIGKAAESAGTKVAAIFGIGGGVVAAGMAVGMGILVKQAITLNSTFEQFQVSLQTTLGNLTAAKEEMAKIVTFAKETPYTIQEVTDAVVKLRAYSMDSDKWLRPLGDMASAFGRTITDAVEAAADASMGMFRRALSYGIKMERVDFKKGGKYAGMTYAEAFLMEVEKRFKGGMQLQAQTLKGIWSNIKDVMTIQVQQATKPLYNFIKQIVGDFYNKLNSGQYTANLQKKFQEINQIIWKVIDGLKSMISYIRINIAPVFKSFGEAGLKTFTSIVKIVTTFATALGGPVAKTIASAVYLVSELVQRFQWLIKILVAIKLSRFIFALLTKDIVAMSMSMVAANEASSLFAARLSIIASRAVKAGAALLGMMVFSKFMETRNELAAIGNAFDDVAGGAGELKGYLQGLGNEFGQDLESMAKAANAAKDFGANAANALYQGAKAAKILNLNAEESVRVIGTLAKSYIHANDTAGVMATKTEQVAAALENMKDAGVNMNDAISTMEQYSDVMAKTGDNLDGLSRAVIAYSKATGGAPLANFFEQISKLLTPDVDMLMKLDPTIWISKSTKDLRDLGTEGNAYADTIEDLMQRNNRLGQSYDSLGNYMGENVYTMTDMIALVKQLSAAQEAAQEAVLKWSDAVQAAQEEVNKLQGQLDDLSLDLAKLGSTMDQISNVFNLAIAINQMKVYNDVIAETGMTIQQMNDKIAKDEAQLAKLNVALTSVSNKFDDINNRIKAAQEALDKFTHPKLEGMGAFDDKIHGIDMQLNALNRQKIDIANKLKPFEDAGLTDTAAYKTASAPLVAIQAQIDKLENNRQKLELDRSIAYDDQLYQLGKIADTQKEITFSEALKGAKAARAEIDKLSPQLDALGKQKKNLEDQVDILKRSIDNQKALVEQKQAEIDAQKSIYQGELDRLELQKQIYEYEASIVDKKLQGAKMDAMQGIISPENLKMMEDIYNSTAKEAAGKTQTQTDLQAQLAQRQNDLSKANQNLADAQAALSAAEGDLKTAVNLAQQLITGIDYDKLINSNVSALEEVFGPDNKDIFVAMRDYLATIAGKGGMGGTQEPGGLGWTGRLKNFMTGSIGGLVTTAVAGYMGYRGLKTGARLLGTKGVKGLEGALEGKTGRFATTAKDLMTIGERKSLYGALFGGMKTKELQVALTEVQKLHLQDMGTLLAENEKIVALGQKEAKAMADRVVTAKAGVRTATANTRAAKANVQAAEIAIRQNKEAARLAEKGVQQSEVALTNARLNVRKKMAVPKEMRNQFYDEELALLRDRRAIAEANLRAAKRKVTEINSRGVEAMEKRAEAITKQTEATAKKGEAIAKHAEARVLASESAVAQAAKEAELAKRVEASASRVEDIAKLRPMLQNKKLSQEAFYKATTILDDLITGMDDVGSAVGKAAQKTLGETAGALGKSGGLLEKLTMGGIFGPVLLRENMRGMAGGHGLTRVRSMLYGLASGMGTVEATAGGRLGQRVESVYGGKVTGRIMNKLGIRRPGIHGFGLDARYMAGETLLANRGLPEEIIAALGKAGGKPSATLMQMLSQPGVKGMNYVRTAGQGWRYAPGMFKGMAPEMSMGTVGKYALGGRATLPAWAHEMGHALGGKGETVFGDLTGGKVGKVISELNAWKRAADVLKASGIENPMAMKEFRGTAASALYSYTGKGKGSMDLLKQMVEQNKLLSKSGQLVDAAAAARSFAGPMGKFAGMAGGKAGLIAKGVGRAGMFGLLGDVSQIARPVEAGLSKILGKTVGNIAGKGLSLMGKTMMGAGPLGIAALGVTAVNFLKGDFMNEKVWSKLFGGKTIQEFTKDNPVSRYLYSAFGKGNVEKMFKPIGNLWDSATHAVEGLGNVGGMATGLVKGIFTGNYGTMINSAKDFATNVTGVFVDVGKGAVSMVKSIGAQAGAIKNFVTGGSDYNRATEALQKSQLEDAQQYGTQAVKLMEKINKTKDLDQREALRKDYYSLVKDIKQKQDNMKATVAIAKQQGQTIIALQDAVNQARTDDEREAARAMLYEQQRLLKNLQETGKLAPEMIKAAYDPSVVSNLLSTFNDKMAELKIPIAYDAEAFNEIMAAYAKTKADLDNPLQVLVTATLDTVNWDAAESRLRTAKELASDWMTDLTDAQIAQLDAIDQQFSAGMLDLEQRAQAVQEALGKAGDSVDTLNQKLQELRDLVKSGVLAPQAARAEEIDMRYNQSMSASARQAQQQRVNDYVNSVGNNASGASSAVSSLQTMLKSAGYSLTVDGIMGPKTRSAAQDFITRLDRAKDRSTIMGIQNVLNSYDTGGITKWAKNEGRLAVVHGQEGIVPLENGFIPVKLSGDNKGSGSQIVNNFNGDTNFIVRDDNDIETIKKYLLKLMQGQAGFADNPNNYV